jgi:CubicO group peptidase (beta-lactamase class C family)
MRAATSAGTASPSAGERVLLSRRRWRRVAATAVVAIVVLGAIAGGVSVWAHRSTDTSLWARMLVWGTSDTGDWARFPSRPIHTEPSTVGLPHANETVPLGGLTGGTDPVRFFTDTGTTAFVIIHHDNIVFEQYFNGATVNSTQTAFSVTKSYTAAMVGAAIAAGYIHSIDDPITRYVPELVRRDPRFARITIRHLLSMTAGLSWNTGDWPLVNDDEAVYNTTDLRHAALTRPKIIHPAGQTFLYNDFNPALIGLVLERSTHRPVAQWLENAIWKPLAMQANGSFNLDSTKHRFEKMPSGLAGRPIDLTKIGLLYLHQGRWNDRQIVPARSVTDSVSAANSVATGNPHLRYGMGWWILTNAATRAYFAWGNHGQYVLVAPDLDIVVARFGKRDGINDWPQRMATLAQHVAADNPAPERTVR